MGKTRLPNLQTCCEDYERESWKILSLPVAHWTKRTLNVSYSLVSGMKHCRFEQSRNIFKTASNCLRPYPTGQARKSFSVTTMTSSLSDFLRIWEVYVWNLGEGRVFHVPLITITMIPLNWSVTALCFGAVHEAQNLCWGPDASAWVPTSPGRQWHHHFLEGPADSPGCFQETSPRTSWCGGNLCYSLIAIKDAAGSILCIKNTPKSFFINPGFSKSKKS